MSGAPKLTAHINNLPRNQYPRNCKHLFAVIERIRIGMPHLSSAQYGKDNIRVYKVHRDEKSGTQSVAEMTVCVLLRGQIDRAYTEANNSVIVTTDTIKNTVYILAKQNSVTPPELFGAIVATHFVEKYSHIYSAEVKIKVHRWTRIIVDGEPHPHSFIRDGSETRNVELITNADGGIRIRSSIAGLLILKSTGSEFNGFIQDDYTTLPEVNDRVFSTEVDCVWLWDDFSRIEEVKSAASKFDDAWNSARAITLNTFATDKSASVQSTMYKMCEQILALLPAVQSVDYSLPNKHYFEIDLSWHKGLKNTGKDAEVYAPQSNPNGLIQCSVSR